ncbi:hypothetical protein N9M16_09345 [Candidatus Dependentiae bacterium]|nr:hypothetical protein [Candidatus Dependentiae bacterium]
MSAISVSVGCCGRKGGTGRRIAVSERRWRNAGAGWPCAYLVPHHGGRPGVVTKPDGVSRVRSPALLALGPRARSNS